MRATTLLILLLSLLAFTACEFANVFSSDGQRQPTPDGSTTSDTLLYVAVRGGFAGVNQNLLVRKSGLATFDDSFRNGKEWQIQLSQAELDDLDRLFVQEGFLQLDSLYIDQQVADAFIYTVVYHTDEIRKVVVTDNFGAPENLQDIIDGILALIDEVTGTGLDLSLQLSADRLQHGGEIDLTLTVTNTGSEPLRLKFNSGQIFDFCAVSMEQPDGAPPLVWNWAHDMFFTLQVWQLDLQPGEVKSYQVSWDGRDNDGDLLTGAFHLQGKLVSLPGGATGRKTVQIEN